MVVDYISLQNLHLKFFALYDTLFVCTFCGESHDKHIE
jgi:hypothetical protein